MSFRQSGVLPSPQFRTRSRIRAVDISLYHALLDQLDFVAYLVVNYIDGYLVIIKRMRLDVSN